MTTTEIGKSGENAAVKFLSNKGYEIVQTNYRSGKAEIDIVAKQNETLVFVEVKLRKNERFGFPEDFVTKTKCELIKSAAENYIFDTNWQGNIRFDIIAIIGTKEKIKEILHLEDAFY